MSRARRCLRNVLMIPPSFGAMKCWWFRNPIPNHLGCIYKTRRKQWDKLPNYQLVRRISEPSTDTPQKSNIDTKNRPYFKGVTFSKPWFWVSMLDFWGVTVWSKKPSSPPKKTTSTHQLLHLIMEITRNLKLTASLHLKIDRAPKGNDRIPTIHFQVLLSLVSGRAYLMIQPMIIRLFKKPDPKMTPQFFSGYIDNTSQRLFYGHLLLFGIQAVESVASNLYGDLQERHAGACLGSFRWLDLKATPPR